jgi:hypothetical protein
MKKIEPSRVRKGGTVVVQAEGVAVIDACRAIVAAGQYGKINGIMCDTFSASAIVAVYDALNEVNKAKLAALPFGRLASVCFSLLNKKES